MTTPRPARKAWWTPIGLALLCAHCAVGGALVVASASGLAVLPSVLGVPLGQLALPLLALGLFGLWLWSGRERRPAGPVPVQVGRPPARPPD